jgi:hypothetical protein
VLAALGAASVDDRAATAGLHARAETVRASVFEIAGLESALGGHGSIGIVGKEAELWRIGATTVKPMLLCAPALDRAFAALVLRRELPGLALREQICARRNAEVVGESLPGKASDRR